MAINKIQGNILSDNLIRGSNLAFQTDLIYLDVTNGRVGINTAGTTHNLTVSGNARVGNLALSTNALSSDLNIVLQPTGNVLLSNVNINYLADPVANSDAATKFYVDSQSGNVNFTVSDGANTQNVFNGDTVTFQGTANQTTATVSATDTVTLGLAANVTISGTITAGAGDLGDISIFGNTIASAGDLLITASGNIDAGNLVIGNVQQGSLGTDVAIKSYVDSTANSIVANLGNVTFSNVTISTSLANANLVLEPTGTGLLVVNTTTGLVIPVGNTAQQPSPAATGTIRFNTDTSRVEIYDGTAWDDVVANVTNQILYGDNSTAVFTLDKDTTSPAALVAINGIVQLPGVAYTVTGNQITFAQAPVISDVIDIRFL